MDVLYTPAQVAEKLLVSTKTTIRLFENEVGTVVIPSASRTAKVANGKLGKGEAKRLRRYSTIRIPAIVLNRVLDRFKVQ